jgi:hypothetical protein
MGAWFEEPFYDAVPDGEIFETGDGHHVYWLDHPDDQHIRLVWDGVPGERLSSLEPYPDGSRIVASADGKHICYYAGIDRDIHVGLDDTLGPPVEGVTRSVPPTVSETSGRLAYGAYVDGVARLFVDHQPDPRSTAPLAPHPVVWSHDGTRLAWVEHETSTPDARQRVAVDGITGPWTKGISSAEWGLQFSPDSRRVAYYAVTELAGHYVVDGDAGPSTEDSRGFAWSPDSRRFVYDAQIDGRWHIVDDGRVGPAHQSVVLLGFDHLDRLLWMAAQDENRRQIVVDGQRDPAHEDVAAPTVAPDGRRGYAVVQRPSGPLGRFRRRQRMSIDGVPCDEHVWDEISVVLFDSATMPPIYRARAGKAEQVVANSQPGPAFGLIIGPIASSAGHWAYLGLTDSGTALVVDGRALTLPSESVTVNVEQAILFLPDGGRVAWGAELDDGWHPAIGGDLGPACDSVLPPHVDGDGLAYWHAVRDNTLVRISYRD